MYSFFLLRVKWLPLHQMIPEVLSDAFKNMRQLHQLLACCSGISDWDIWTEPLIFNPQFLCRKPCCMTVSLQQPSETCRRSCFTASVRKTACVLNFFSPEMFSQQQVWRSLKQSYKETCIKCKMEGNRRKDLCFSAEHVWGSLEEEH